ncbi:hypothetical protein JANAI62_13190 [Jannaschia pagri]|uniref:Uncharacterized protein n=1 Tax=Jannaschia pagri TaxID=2829797 RepID=A0ABQ4NK25_9RHOB|nr:MULTISPECIES: hypothetical protein [unclassified Jannaschia]GIT90864.1 hypothetical protein JANAI61_13220 [Jannaschia sp. AI_61]GIT94696.1 hypothetical protein JANAI62_13190 [Jannaschia sp. AI_62]
MRLEADIDVLAGPFASQQLAFAHLLDAAERTGLTPDLDHVEVIAAPHAKRLRGYFDPDTAAEIAAEARLDAVILVLPGALITGRFEGDARLRSIGRYVGQVTRA